MQRRVLVGAVAVAAALGGGWAAAQSPAAKAEDHTAHHADKGTPSKGAPERDMGIAGGCMCAKGGGPMGGMGMGGPPMGGMGGPPMGGMGMMGGGFAGMLPPSAKVEVKNLPKGVSISITSDDAKLVSRLQKMAEAMRLMHEANTP